MDIQAQIENWRSVVKKCLSDLNVRYKDFSETQIADRVKIPRTTYNRLANEPKRPSLDTFIKLIVGSGNIQLLKGALENFNPDIANSLKSVLEVSLQDKKSRPDFDLEELFQDRDVFVAFILASMVECGTTEAQVKEVLGSSGIEAIKVLDDHGLLFQKGEQIHLKDKTYIMRSFEGIRYHLTTYARFYQSEHAGKKRNYVHSVTGGLNQHGIEELQALHREFHLRALEIMRKDQNQGNTPMFSVAFCDSFNSIEKAPTKEELQ